MAINNEGLKGGGEEVGRLMDLKILERISTQVRSQVIGWNRIIDTPFGQRYLVYADYSASGRALSPIEDFIRDEVLPVYGNVHSQSTWTARQSNYFREEAREIARNYLHADHETAIIFTGSGATGAISTFMGIMTRQNWRPAPKSYLRETRWHSYRCDLCEGLQLENLATAKAHLNSDKHIAREEKKKQEEAAASGAEIRTLSPAGEREASTTSSDRASLVIFLLDPSLHHSAMLPMRELAQSSPSKFRVEFLELNSSVAIDVGILRSKLDAIKVASEVWSKELSITTWCIINGCSNVTGAKANISDLAGLIHQYHHTYLAVDLASALGSMPINLSSTSAAAAAAAATAAAALPSSSECYMDVGFFSPHKLLGGPSTCGLLTIRKELLNALTPPGVVGGGVVRFVSRDLQLYELALEHREEAGTPNIIGCIRTGMVLKLASQIPYYLSTARENEHMAFCLKMWCRNKRIQILGPVSIMEPQMNCSTQDLIDGARDIENKYLGIRKSVISFMIKYGNHLQSGGGAGAAAAAVVAGRRGSQDSRGSGLGSQESRGSAVSQRGGGTSNSTTGAVPASVEQPISVSETVNKGVCVSQYRNKTSHTGGLYLHHNFVCAVLNDLFGIQARPGCACAGPLAHDLLGIGSSLVSTFLKCLEETGCEVLRPGFCRITFHYTMSIDDVELIAQAVNWVAQFGWKLLPYYTFNSQTGEWTQNIIKPDHFRKWISHMTLNPASGASWGETGVAASHAYDSEEVGGGGGRRKDPKKLAGAVAMPGLNQDAIIAMRAALAKRPTPPPKKKPAEDPSAPTSTTTAASTSSTTNAAATAAAPPGKQQAATNDSGTPKTKSVAEIRKMLEKKSTAAAQPTGQGKLKTVKALASKFERSASLKSQSLIDSPCIRSPSMPQAPPQRRPSLKSNEGTKPIRCKSPPPVKNSAAEEEPATVGEEGAAEKDVILVQKSKSDLTTTPVALKSEIEQAPASGVAAPTTGPAPATASADAAAPAAAGSACENGLASEIDEVRRAVVRSAQRAIPSELQDFYDRANELIDGLKPGCGNSSALANLSRQGLCPPLPQQYAELLWFALPGDAVYSLGIFKPAPNEGEPAVCVTPADPGYPLWISSENVKTSPNRPIDSIFETVSYPVRLMKKGESESYAAASGDALLAWINDSAEVEVTANASKILTSPVAGQDRNRVPAVTVQPQTIAAREATSVVVDSSSNACNSIAAEVGSSIDGPSPAESLLKDIASAEGSDPDEVSIGQTNYSGSALAPTIPRFFRRKLGEAVNKFSMISEGDRILVGLSGGKDSLSMLHLLMDLQRRCPVRFELGAATVNPMTIEYDPSPLVPYLESLKVPYYMLSYPIMALAAEKMQGHSLCAFCARMKRGMLYSCMKRYNFNKLALGQHMDDVAESFLMSAFYNGSLNTMKANYTTVIKDHNGLDELGDPSIMAGPCAINIIRPLIFVREKELAQFAQNNHLPIIADNCPACFRAPKERLRMKHLLAAQEFEHPATLQNIKKAVMPLMAVSQSDLMKIDSADQLESLVDDEPMCSGAFCGRSSMKELT